MRDVENRFADAQLFHPRPAVVSGKTGYGLAQLLAGEEKMLVID